MDSCDLDRRPDFYMVSAEAEHLREVRAVYAIRRIRASNRDDCLLAWVEPAIDLVMPSESIVGLQIIVLTARVGGQTLFPVQEWPTFVYIDRLLTPVQPGGSVEDGTMSQIGWGEIHHDPSIATETSQRFWRV